MLQTCGVHCHRICAGPPWSTFTPDGDGDEQKWQCEDCRCGFPVSFLSEWLECEGLRCETHRISFSTGNCVRLCLALINQRCTTIAPDKLLLILVGYSSMSRKGFERQSHLVRPSERLYRPWSAGSAWTHWLWADSSIQRFKVYPRIHGCQRVKRAFRQIYSGRIFILCVVKEWFVVIRSDIPNAAVLFLLPSLPSFSCFSSLSWSSSSQFSYCCIGSRVFHLQNRWLVEILLACLQITWRKTAREGTLGCGQFYHAIIQWFYSFSSLCSQGQNSRKCHSLSPHS